MTIEYIVLGALLMVMGAAQIWLRHAPRFKRRDEVEEGESKEGESKDWKPEDMPARFAPRTRSGAGWSIWTAILGPIGLVFGIFLVILGVLGR